MEGLHYSCFCKTFETEWQLLEKRCLFISTINLPLQEALRSLTDTCSEVPCSKRGATLDRRTGLYFVKYSFMLGGFTLFFEKHIIGGAFIRAGSGSRLHLQIDFGTGQHESEKILRERFLWALEKRIRQKCYV